MKCSSRSNILLSFDIRYSLFDILRFKLPSATICTQTQQGSAYALRARPADPRPLAVGIAHPTFSLQNSPPFLKVYGPGTWETNVSETWVTGWKCSSDRLKIPLNPPLKKGDFMIQFPVAPLF